MAELAWWARLRAKRPWWRIYPTRRLALVVAVVALAWIVPAIGAAFAALSIAALVIVVAIDYLRLPRKNAVIVERAAP
ncbi:MAG TPA: hypothetical protein VN600_15650, partial [Gemmatimonadaceae bacterium]|nr:hypothetical protein [Gemmatimonadaceae bacterium]